MSTAARLAVAPFHFFTVAHVTRMSGLAANSLAELAEALEVCSDESIYHHTIRALGSPNIQDGQNDFAVWAGSSLNRRDLAEQLAGLDSRDYSSITEMRNDLCLVVGDYLTAHPEAADLAGPSAFCFWEGTELAVPLESSARTLEEFRDCVAGSSGESLYLHLIAARSRHQQKSNDFSAWLSGSLGLEALARRIEGIDVLGCTIEGARETILKLVDEEKTRRGPAPAFAPGQSIGATIGSERATGDHHEMDTGWNQPGR